MYNGLPTSGRGRGALSSLVLALMVAAGLLVSGARAEDPPIVSVGPVSSGGNTASGSVGSGGQSDACVNDQQSSADPSAADPNKAATVNQGSCQAAQDSSASTGSKAGGSRRTSSSSAAGVTSARAVGLRIVCVRHVTKGVSVTKRFRVYVTLRDLRGRLVRDAIVSVSRVPGARNTISGMYSTFSNRFGQASVRVPVTKRLLGERLFLKIAARTPKARAIALRSVRLPALG